MAEPLRKRVARIDLPQSFEPKWEYTMVHGLGEDVVYSVYDNNDRKEVQLQDVTVGVDYIRFEFKKTKPLNVKIVVIG